jgi:acetate kinase
MNVLVFNCGSSSLTFKVFEASNKSGASILLSGKAHRVGVRGAEPSSIEFHYGESSDSFECPLATHAEAAAALRQKLAELRIPIDLIGHRWVQSAGRFTTTWIDEAVTKDLVALLPLFPIHHPAMLGVIRYCIKEFPTIPQYITADGAFHRTIPAYAYSYALPRAVVSRFGFRKFGFHGLSYQYVAREAARFLEASPEELRIIACHLGTGGSSVAAIKGGHSVDTSMGYTALSGLVMSTRCGDIDPMLTLYLMAVHGYRPDELLESLNKKSGLLGVSGFSSDIRDLIPRISEDKHASLAFEMYIHAVKKYIGSYVVVLHGCDALVFTDDIGVHSPTVRQRVCGGMEWCGVVLGKEKNLQVNADAINLISSESSRVAVLTIPTEEELVIFQEGMALAASAKEKP